jgi:hypothetical protein
MWSITMRAWWRNVSNDIRPSTKADLMIILLRSLSFEGSKRPTVLQDKRQRTKDLFNLRMSKHQTRNT